MAQGKLKLGQYSKSFFDSTFPTGSWQRKIIVFAVFSIVLLVLLYLIADNIVMPIITRHGSEFELPNVIGYQLEDAENILEMTDLSGEVISAEYHPDKEDGTIISQYPPAGTMVKAGRKIKIVTSVGQKNVMIPQLSGFSVRQALLNIEAAGLILGDIVWTYSDSLPEKVVVFSYPASGMEIPMGSQVNLMVNRGSLSGIVYMPRLVGRPLDEARTILGNLGLIIGLVTQVTNENYLPETVLEQSVEPATELEVGEEIDLIVSTTE
ncbi:MAG: PASTA domain-containing protein [Candidatus Zixiibacteriota bacterium]